MKFCSYRVEMQLRGMAHIHGCIWLKENALHNFLKNKTLDDSKLPALVDKFITCQLPAENHPLRRKVLELQVHHHTKSCLRKTGVCRFRFPRLPSQRTIIAEPCPDLPHEIMEKSAEILRQAKQILSSDHIPNNFQDFFDQLSVTSEE